MLGKRRSKKPYQAPDSAIMWCSNCGKQIARPDYVEGKTCCPLCGRVLDEDNFSNEVTFVKNAAGQSQPSGNYVSSQNDYSSASRGRTLSEARDGIEGIMYALGIDGGESIYRPALAFYTIGVERNFTRGRRKEQVQAACLYTACREKQKPYLLIDFSEHLRINVYVLGAVFLQLCKLLSLEEHPIIQKPVDPSLFIHRFTDRLFGGKNHAVSKTALHIIASMKRDWMQTGRKPSGLCGAALYISALSHGLKCTKSEIIKVVHVCETTLMKRLIEFENTESGGLTIEEFNMKADELEKEEKFITSLSKGSKASGINELLCKHKSSGEAPFAHGLCKGCYEEFSKLSGGLNGGSEPPAFQRAEMERIMAKEAAAAAENPKKLGAPLGNPKKHVNTSLDEQRKSGSTGATGQHKIMNDSSKNSFLVPDATFEESESLSDIEDNEVDLYIHNEEEKKLKKIIWEEMNKEYLEEQAAKEAVALAAKKAYEAAFANCSGDVQAAQRLAAAAAEAVSKSKKEKQQKRAAELKSLGPAQTAHEAAKQALDRKRLGNKISLDALEKLFDESENSPDTKRRRTDPDSDHDDKYPDNSKDDTEIEGTHDDDTYNEDVEEEYIENVREINDDYNYDEDTNFFDDF